MNEIWSGLIGAASGLIIAWRVSVNKATATETKYLIAQNEIEHQKERVAERDKIIEQLQMTIRKL